MHYRSVVPILIELLKDDDEKVRTWAVRGLRSFGADALPAIPLLKKGLDHWDARIRTLSAAALGSIDPENHVRVIPFLTQCLGEDDYLIRCEAASGLGSFGHRSSPAVPKLIDLMKDPDGRVRGSVARTLGKIGKEAMAAIPLLTTALDDESRFVREAAAEAITNIQNN